MKGWIDRLYFFNVCKGEKNGGIAKEEEKSFKIGLTFLHLPKES